MKTLQDIGLKFRRIPLAETAVIKDIQAVQPKIIHGDLQEAERVSLKGEYDRTIGIEYEVYVSDESTTKQTHKIESEQSLWLSMEDDTVEDRSIEIMDYISGTVILDYSGHGVHHGVTNIVVHEGATLNIYKLQNYSLQSTFVDQVKIEVEDRGQVNIIDIQLGGHRSIVNYETNLKGFQSKCNLKSVYLVTDDRGMDLSFTANHIGKKTESEILGKGVLSGHGKKVFRGTLDFKLGSTQSVGKEEESVLLLSETVKSDSIPALMCSEDDVIGEHGASIGQLDEEQLFYLMSRGIEEHQAKLLVIASALKTWMEDIEDDQFREKVLTALDGSIEHAL